MKRLNVTRPDLLALALVILLLPATATLAQRSPDTHPAGPAEWSAGFRLGLFDMTNSADSYDAIYGDPMPRVGGQVERQRGHLRFALSFDYGQVDGERVLLTGNGFRGTGIDEQLTLAPVHLTAAWRFNPLARWEWSAGLGPSFLFYDNGGEAGSDSGSDFGGSALLGLRHQGPTWDFGGELRWSTFPGALDDSRGVLAFFDEDDPGGVSLTFTALRRF